MRIQYIELVGFRGVAQHLRVDCPTGFVVVVGPNGSGKSTLCDAIEFALMGSIRGASSHKEKGETVLDYLWWRGPSPPQNCYVELGLVDDDGQQHTIRRTPTGHQLTPEGDLNSLLCTPGNMLENALSQLCRTAIVRDEEITQLSVDLRETERFELVRAVLGTTDLRAAEAKTKRATDLAQQQAASVQREYAVARDRVSHVSARLSQAKVEATKAVGVPDAEAHLQSFLGPPAREPSELLPAAEQALAELRVRTDRLTRLYTRLDDVLQRRRTITTEAYQEKLRVLTEATDVARRSVDHARAEADRAGTELAEAQAQSPATASLALLSEHGRRLGLQDGRCPLCGSPHGQEQFSAHLDSLRRRIEATNAELSRLTQHNTQARDRLVAAERELAARENEVRTLRRAQDAVEAELPGLRAEATEMHCDLGPEEEPRLEALAGLIESSRVSASKAEAAIAVLAASRGASQVAELDRELNSAKEELVRQERQLSHWTKVQGELRDAAATIKRVQGEVVDERLAELSPLLVELYQRLRPHVDWQSVRYRLRGDVRRMLSFEVGEGLNPSFVFSSGQRRAAGLAFVLALHLSRRWCKFQTLVLDDPVQHVDDYRALHLVEVLAAIRRTGRQVICTVEDVALGKLLARRLRSTLDSPGLIVSLRYSPGEGAQLRERREIHPFSRNVLISA